MERCYTTLSSTSSTANVELLLQRLPGVVKRASGVTNSNRSPQGMVRNSRVLAEGDVGGNVAEPQRVREFLMRTGMVMSCPLLAATAPSILDDYSGSAVALEADNVVAIPAAMSPFAFELLHRVGVPLADLDPDTAKLAINVLGPFFAFFNLLFIFRIVMSWYPQIPVRKFPFVLAYAPTEPILGPTRRLIPPVGGVDVAPVIWVALMSFLNEILLGKQGLFILLSQQQS